MSEGTTKTDGWFSSEHGAMMVCADCFEIYGPWHYKGRESGEPDLNLFQYCGSDCPSRNRKPGIPFKEGEEGKWPRFDFNTVVELCYCCGQELLKSGSRWDVWFCDECKERVVQFNKKCQWTVIPIGRHSIMAGYGMGRDQIIELENSGIDPFKRFIENLDSLSKRIDFLRNTKQLIFTDNFKSLGYSTDILLKDYLEQSKRVPDKSACFLRLRDFFEQALKSRQPS